MLRVVENAETCRQSCENADFDQQAIILLFNDRWLSGHDGDVIHVGVFIVTLGYFDVVLRRR